MSQEPSRPPLVAAAGLDLDDLLAEIRRRTAGARESHERMAELLDAVVTIGSDLDLSSVLQRIVESAARIVGARYGALGVLAPSGASLAEFHTYGIDDDTRHLIGELPRGEGVLGHLIREPRLLRIEDLTRHPSAVGFPPGHPPMRTFIGAPLRVRDKVFGNLYLTEREDGGPFTADDEVMLRGLAAAAGIAIENADMYARARGRQEWSQAVAELTQTLLEGRNERAALARMVKRVRELADAQFALFAVRDVDGHLMVDAVEPRPPDSSTRAHGAVAGAGRVALRDHRWQLICESRTPLVVLSLPRDGEEDALLSELRRAAGFDDEPRPDGGSAAIVPLTVGAVEVGLVALTWDGDDGRRATVAMDLLTAFAEQMALAVEAGRAQRQRSRTRLLEERDRIARDMHDHVIQRLYAAGLSLQVTARGLDDGPQQRLEHVVGELDSAVKDIRRAIFELHQRLPEGGLGPEIESLVAQAGEACGFVPDLAIEGVLADVPPELEQDVLAVVREGLSNIVRHSRASDAQVRVSTLGDILVVICDDGVGLAPGTDLRGLRNLDDRARTHSGTFSVSARSPSGTMLRWRVPVASGAPTRPVATSGPTTDLE